MTAVFRRQSKRQYQNGKVKRRNCLFTSIRRSFGEVVRNRGGLCASVTFLPVRTYGRRDRFPIRSGFLFQYGTDQSLYDPETGDNGRTRYSPVRRFRTSFHRPENRPGFCLRRRLCNGKSFGTAETVTKRRGLGDEFDCIMSAPGRKMRIYTQKDIKT